jgi:hypothetical protein
VKGILEWWNNGMMGREEDRRQETEYRMSEPGRTEN